QLGHLGLDRLPRPVHLRGAFHRAVDLLRAPAREPHPDPVLVSLDRRRVDHHRVRNPSPRSGVHRRTGIGTDRLHPQPDAHLSTCSALINGSNFFVSPAPPSPPSSSAVPRRRTKTTSTRRCAGLPAFSSR